MSEVTLTVTPGDKSTGSGFTGLFGVLSHKAQPGETNLTINGLPAGTRYISVWVTECTEGDSDVSMAGGALFFTSSVQLYENGTKCRVRFSQNWHIPLKAAVQGIYGS